MVACMVPCMASCMWIGSGHEERGVERERWQERMGKVGIEG